MLARLIAGKRVRGECRSILINSRRVNDSMGHAGGIMLLQARRAGDDRHTREIGIPLPASAVTNLRYFLTGITDGAHLTKLAIGS